MKVNRYPPPRYFGSDFGRALDAALGRAQPSDRERITKAYTESLAIKALRDHPDFEHLQPGQHEQAFIAALFVDLCDFTARSAFASLAEMFTIRRTILLPFAQITAECGGHVQDIPGDGMLCYFGGRGSDSRQ